MTTHITRDPVFYAFHPALQPVAHIRQGEQAVLETHDCFGGNSSGCLIRLS